MLLLWGILVLGVLEDCTLVVGGLAGGFAGGSLLLELC
jgi:hypothetical protein